MSDELNPQAAHAQQAYQQDFEQAFADKSSAGAKLFGALHSPWSFFREALRLSGRALGNLSIALLVFILYNTAALVYAIYKLAMQYSNWGLAAVFGVLALGIGAVVLSWYKALYFVSVDSIQVIYKHLEGFFRRISHKICERVANFYANKVEGDMSKKVLDWGSVLGETYGKLPKVLSTVLTFLLRLVPFVALIQDIGIETIKADREKAGDTLYESVDKYLHENIFDGNDLTWIAWLLPLNLMLQGALIYWGI